MIGVAILGAGFMARTHAAAWAQHPDRAAVRVVASRTLESAAKVASLCGADVTDDLHGALARGDVDVVDICLPTPLHRPFAEAAFAAGRDVLLEKPIALTVEDAEAIISARDVSGRRLLLGFVLRFWPEYEELARVVAAGSIGTPLAVSTLRLSAPPDWNEWMFDSARSGGVAVDFLIHDIDQVNALLGRPLSVHARAVTAGPFDAPQHMLATITCEGGIATVEGGLMLPASYPFTSCMRILGTEGVIEYPFSAPPSDDGGNIGSIDPAATALTLYPADGPSQRIDVAAADPWGGEIEYLIRCIEDDERPSRATGEDALLALRVALAANASLATGQVERIG
jgi:predicted dehydrogenase